MRYWVLGKAYWFGRMMNGLDRLKLYQASFFNGDSGQSRARTVS